MPRPFRVLRFYAIRMLYDLASFVAGRDFEVPAKWKP